MGSLANLLADASERQLQRVTSLWGGEEAPGQTQAQIKAALRDLVRLPFAARCVWQQLDQAAARCLYEVVSAPPKKGVRYEQLLKKTRLPAQTVEKALVWLQEHWLLTSSRIPPPIPLVGPRPDPDEADIVYLPLPECASALSETGQERFARGGDRSGWTLLHLLDHLPFDTVEALARRCAVPLQTYKHWQAVPVPAFEVRRNLAQRLETGLVIFALLRSLDCQALRLWLWLWDQRGSAPLATVQTALSLTLRDLAQLVPHMESLALAFDTLTSAGERLLFIPTSLYTALGPAVAAWRAEAQAHDWLPLDTAPTPAPTGAPSLLYDLAVLVGWVYQTTVEPTNAGLLPKRLRSQLRLRLQGMQRLDEFSQDAYPDLLLQAALDLRLVQRVTPHEDARPRYAPGPALATWGQAGLEEQTTRFLAWWKTSTVWQDLLPDQRTLPAYYWTEADRARLIEHLRCFEDSQWYRLASLFYALWQQAPLDLSVQAQGETSPFAMLQAQRERWQEREGQRTLGMLASTLRELGLVELGLEAATAALDETAEPTAIRLTALGARVLGVARDDARALPAAPAHPLIVQPSFELICLETRLPLLYELLPWAEVGQVGLASTLRLTRAALLRGLAQGGTLSELLSLLTRESGRDLPQNVAYTLRDWARGFKGTRLSQVFLLSVSNADVASQIIQVLAEHRIHAERLSDALLAIESRVTSESAIYRYLEQAEIVVQRGMPR